MYKSRIAVNCSCWKCDINNTINKCNLMVSTGTMLIEPENKRGNLMIGVNHPNFVIIDQCHEITGFRCHLPFRLYPEFRACIVVHRLRPASGSCPRWLDRIFLRKSLVQIVLWAPICRHLHYQVRQFYIHAFCIFCFFELVSLLFVWNGTEYGLWFWCVGCYYDYFDLLFPNCLACRFVCVSTSAIHALSATYRSSCHTHNGKRIQDNSHPFDGWVQ